MSNCRVEEMSDQQVERYAEMFKALSNGNRLRIFLELIPHLATGRGCSSDVQKVEAYQREIAFRMNLAPSTVSHHIKELKNAGLVTIVRSGRNVDVEINPEKLSLLRSLLEV